MRKKLDSKETNYLLSIKPKEISLELIQELIAFTEKRKPRYDPTDIFILPKGKYYNGEDLQTTVGKYIFNITVINETTGPLLGYQNKVMDGDGIAELDNKMAILLRKDKIDTKTFSWYLDRMQWLGFGTAKFMNASLTTELLIPPAKVKAKKAELLEKYKTELDNADPLTVSKFEKELLDLAREEVKDFPSMDIYDSGSRGSFNNNYKNVNISRGLIPDMEDPTRYQVSTSSLYDGIQPDEMYKYANILTMASSSRAIGTRVGGLRKIS